MGTAQIAAGPCALSSPRSVSSTHTQRHWGPEAPATGLLVDPRGLLGWPLRHVRSRKP